MTGRPIDFDGAADIADAIEQAGGDVRDFDTATVQRSNVGLGGMMDALMNGSSVRVYRFEVVIPGDTDRDIDLDDVQDDEDQQDEPADDAADDVADIDID